MKRFASVFLSAAVSYGAAATDHSFRNPQLDMPKFVPAVSPVRQYITERKFEHVRVEDIFRAPEEYGGLPLKFRVESAHIGSMWAQTEDVPLPFSLRPSFFDSIYLNVTNPHFPGTIMGRSVVGEAYHVEAYKFEKLIDAVREEEDVLLYGNFRKGETCTGVLSLEMVETSTHYIWIHTGKEADIEFINKSD